MVKRVLMKKKETQVDGMDYKYFTEKNGFQYYRCVFNRKKNCKGLIKVKLETKEIFKISCHRQFCYSQKNRKQNSDEDNNKNLCDYKEVKKIVCFDALIQNPWFLLGILVILGWTILFLNVFKK